MIITLSRLAEQFKLLLLHAFISEVENRIMLRVMHFHIVTTFTQTYKDKLEGIYVKCTFA